MIEKILNEDGTEYDPPRNPLSEKWTELYPPCESKGYTCMFCGNCPCGDYWKVPEDDLTEDDMIKWTNYKQAICQYNLDHGNVINDAHRENLKKMINVSKEFLERLTNEKFKDIH